VLPPTVLGFYLLVTFGARSPVGQAFQTLFGQALPFTFTGLLVASSIASSRAMPTTPGRRSVGMAGEAADATTASL
jgi:ABC-type molybdate transport system permease subunit